VPAHLYEDMVNFVEFSQRGTAELKSIPAKFSGEGLDIGKVANDMAAKLIKGNAGDFEEWP
jgi:antitoxin StbD